MSINKIRIPENFPYKCDETETNHAWRYREEYEVTDDYYAYFVQPGFVTLTGTDSRTPSQVKRSLLCLKCDAVIELPPASAPLSPDFNPLSEEYSYA